MIYKRESQEYSLRARIEWLPTFQCEQSDHAIWNGYIPHLSGISSKFKPFAKFASISPDIQWCGFWEQSLVFRHTHLLGQISRQFCVITRLSLLASNFRLAFPFCQDMSMTFPQIRTRESTFQDHSNCHALDHVLTAMKIIPTVFSSLRGTPAIRIPANTALLPRTFRSYTIKHIEFDSPSTIMQFLDWAFSYRALKSILISSSVKMIDASCFARRYFLSPVELDSGSQLVEMADSCFANARDCPRSGLHHHSK
jgi:hypothetical protein